MTDSEYRVLYDRSPAAAQNALFDEYLNYVYSIVYNKLRSCGREQDIEECVSDVFSAVFLSYDGSQTVNGDLKGFIGKIASNKAINMFHSLSARNGRTAYIDELEGQLPSEGSVAENAERSELRDIMIRCIKALGEPESTMVIHKYYYNMKSGEIGRRLSMPAGTVRVRCSRALKKLKTMLAAEGYELKEGKI
ncbi:RNA polymerase sigma factor [uncultured Ruminococcus sp.]|uniref:RNA polymerase sigma factor n=1 Tax=uncultured Ruminococcus sp. TaxID=165186 RepID=UPI0026274ECF|nr:sigma-70 family RNA polymerase sigma factor [uncultured Ruminococcus sp.]